MGRFFFASGIDAVNPASGMPEPDEREHDVDVSYEPRRGWIEGFSLRVRVGLVRKGGTAGLLPDMLSIMNYEVPF